MNYSLVLPMVPTGDLRRKITLDERAPMRPASLVLEPTGRFGGRLADDDLVGEDIG